jgi:LDH2 family malate/lactate/ureidoglycolate dehydrogenase
MTNQTHGLQYASLVSYATQLLDSAGLEADKSAVVAKTLVEADLLGHDTHGLAQLAGYLNELTTGKMANAGDPEVISERAAVATWDGRRLPGCWLTQRAIDWCLPRAKEFGIASVAIRRSHHIACLAAYLEAPARAGLVVEVLSSDPAAASVAPFGGTRAVFTPNPIAIGVPTSGDPMMIDISSSITTNAMTGRLKDAGPQADKTWWLSANGEPSNDAATLFTTPPGSILPLGGTQVGHKGYGMALMIEALTAGLSGFGRADPSEGWGATVLVRLSDPQAFAGTSAFYRQMDWLTDACHANAPADPAHPVRLPGERGLARKREQLANGIVLHPSILPALAPWAKRFNLNAI